MRALLLVRIANLFRAPVESVPHFSMLMKPKDEHSAVAVEDLENLILSLKVVENFYSHSVEEVIFINDDDKFVEAIRGISEVESKESSIIGIDCEYIVNESNVELLQLAINNKIYLVDCRNIGKMAWEYFVTHVAQNGSLNKLGFDLVNEEKMLSLHIGKTVSLIPKTDLKFFAKKIINQLKLSTNSQSIPDDYSTGGLSSLTYSVLHKSLDKTIRTSNWKTRPFSREQLNYAANDAYVCIDIYKRLHLLSRIYNSINESILSNTKVYLELTEFQTTEKLESPMKIDKTTPIIIPFNHEELGRRLRSLGFSNVYFGVVIDTTAEIKRGRKPPIAYHVDHNLSREEQWTQLCHFIGCQDDKATHCEYCGGDDFITVTDDMIANFKGTDKIIFPTPLRNVDDAISAVKSLKKINDGHFKCCSTCGSVKPLTL